MSLLWRDRISIALSPDRIALVRLTRGLRTRVTAKRCEILVPQPAEAPWHAALARLEDILIEPEWKNADVTVVLSNHFMRYACIPRIDKVSKDEEQLALARYRFAHIYGDVAQNWTLRLNTSDDAATHLASAVDTELLAGVRQLLLKNQLDCISIQPYLMASFNQFTKRITKDNVWFAAVESGKLCLALLKGGQWHRVQMCRVDGVETLNTWLDRENLASDLATPCRDVLLFAPETAQSQNRDSSYHIQRLALPAYEGFSPLTDRQYAMAMSGVM